MDSTEQNQLTHHDIINLELTPIANQHDHASKPAWSCEDQGLIRREYTRGSRHHHAAAAGAASDSAFRPTALAPNGYSTFEFKILDSPRKSFDLNFTDFLLKDLMDRYHRFVASEQTPQFVSVCALRTFKTFATIPFSQQIPYISRYWKPTPRLHASLLGLHRVWSVQCS